jgi:Transposase DDE domain/Domain of unknown function (DUF4372)
MNTGKTLFAQLMDFLPWSTFARIVSRYDGDRAVRGLPCGEQFRAMAFAQLTYRESLRDIEACLSAQAYKLYHIGFRQPVRRSTLSDANEARDWRIYAEFAHRLIVQARRLYAGDSRGADLKEAVYALDSTTIDLCLSVFPWAHFRSTKSAVKMHTLLDLRGNIPSFIHISNGKMHDVRVLDMLVPEAGAIYVMDRAYVDFARLYALHQAGAFFVTRAKSNLRAHRVYSAQADRVAGIVADQTIALDGTRTRQECPIYLRRIRFKDPETGKTLVFLTNQTTLPAATVCDLYKARWKVEIFFKWIKQHLRIKRFYGTSENAVKTQIWIAVSVYVLVAIVRKRLNLEVSLYTFLQVVSVSVFEKMPIQAAFLPGSYGCDTAIENNQLNLFVD